MHKKIELLVFGDIMKNRLETIPAAKAVSESAFSDFFKPQNQANAKEALRNVTAKANSEQKAVIMSYRTSRMVDCC